MSTEMKVGIGFPGNLYRSFAELSDDPQYAMDMEAMWRGTVSYLGHPLRSQA